MAESQNPATHQGVSRRALLGAGAALGLGAVLSIDVFGPAAARAAVAPTSAAGVIALGRAYTGMGLQAIRPLTDTPWSGYPNDDWCAWFISWISRGLGYGYQTWASAWDHLPSPASNAAQVGDFARIGTGAGAVHIGIVTGVAANGTVTSILDGNRLRGTATYWGNSYVREEGPYAPYVLRRPTYLSSGYTSEDDMPKSIYYIASSASASGIVANGDMWVRTAPGEPLRAITSGQAYDYFVMEALDYNSANVKSKPGSWFDLAFAEDNTMATKNVAAHPWMA